MAEHTASTPDASGQDRPGWLMGRIRGVPIYVAPSWAIVALLITVMFAPTVGHDIPEIGAGRFAVSFAFAVLLYASVLVHELGHALSAMRFSVPVRRITLQLLGGVTEREAEAGSPRQEFGIAAAGPLLSILLGLGAWGAIQLLGGDPGGLTGASAAGDPEDAVSLRVALELLDALMYANLVVGIFNLLPGLPLDGGLMLRSAIWAATGRATSATIVTAWIGRGLAIVVFFVPIGLAVAIGRDPDLIAVIWGGLLAGFIWLGATGALRHAQLHQRLPGLGARSLARRAIPVPGELPLAEALRRLGAADAQALVAVDARATPVGLVSAAAVSATPASRRPWIAVADLARRIEPGLIVPADLTGQEFLRHLNATPATEYLVVDPSGAIVGVLATDDVTKAVRS